MRTERRLPGVSSPEIDLMKGFQAAMPAKSVRSDQTRSGGASISMLVSTEDGFRAMNAALKERAERQERLDAPRA